MYSTSWRVLEPGAASTRASKMLVLGAEQVQHTRYEQLWDKVGYAELLAVLAQSAWSVVALVSATLRAPGDPWESCRSPLWLCGDRRRCRGRETPAHLWKIARAWRKAELNVET